MAGEIDKKNLSLLDDEDTDGSEEIENDEDFDLDGDSDEELGAATDEESETDESEEIDDEVDLDEDDELDESENSDEQNGEKVGSNDSGEDNNSTAADSQEEKDAIIENLKKQNSKFRAQAKETLEKLGFKVDGDNVEEALEQAAAESDGVSLEEYRKTKDDAAEVERARETLRRQKFETLAANDLAELKKSFPDLLETKQIKDAFTNIDEFAKFGRLRDSGIDAKTAYLAVKGNDVRAKQSAAATQKAVNDGKNHITSVAPKKAAGDGITMPKSTLKEWREMFPRKTDKEIIQLYKKTL